MKNRIAAVAYALLIPFLWIVCFILAISLGLKGAVYAFINECRTIFIEAKGAYSVDKQVIKFQWDNNVSYKEALEMAKTAERGRRINKIFGNSQN